MQIKIKKLVEDVKIPSYAHPSDAGMDLYSNEDYTLQPNERHVFNLGFALEIPDGYVSLVWDKGSLPFNAGIHALAGVCDAGFRGEYIVILINLGNAPYKIEKGDKIAQLLIQKVEQAEIKEVNKLSESSRGSGKLGSTGKK